MPISETEGAIKLVIQSARKAIQGVFEKKARGVVLKSLGLTILLFFGLWLGFNQLFNSLVFPLLDGWTWVITAFVWLMGAGLVVGAGFLLAPVTAVFAGLFLDEVAEQVERDVYPEDPPGKPMALLPSLLLAAKFGALVLIANLVALLLVWFAGFGVIIFFLLNGYLLGREYFQFAAMRHHPENYAHQMHRKYSFEIFLGGLIIAGFMSVPILNLLTPVFAAKLMVHLYKAVNLKFQPQV